MNFLIADKSKTVQEVLEFVLERQGYGVYSTSQANEALDYVRNNCCNIALVNSELDDGNGVDLVKDLKRLDSKLVIIFMSSNDSMDLKHKVHEYGAVGWVMKPFIPERLVKMIIKTFLQRK